MTKKITLTQGKFALVDDEDYEFINQFNWCFYQGRALRAEYSGRHSRILMHRLINKTPDGMLTDHINMDQLDNRKENLRDATKSQNMMNRNAQSNNKSGYKGVHWNKTNKNWNAQIALNGKSKHLGVFQNKEDAALAYDHAAMIHHGKFSKLNH